VLRKGHWRLLKGAVAWEGNGSFDDFIVYAWEDDKANRVLVAINYSAHRSQCYVHLPFTDLRGRQWRLTDLLGEAQYLRDGGELEGKGLYLDLSAWEYHVFEMRA